jgi:hypothetical protein
MIDEGWNSHVIECMSIFSGAFVSRQSYQGQLRGHSSSPHRLRVRALVPMKSTRDI